MKPSDYSVAILDLSKMSSEEWKALWEKGVISYVSRFEPEDKDELVTVINDFVDTKFVKSYQQPSSETLKSE